MVSVKDLMIDIETMGTGPNAAMIQLAGVFFDRDTGETGAEFCQSLDENDLKSLGYTFDVSTKEWWAKQNQDVLKDIRAKALPVIDVITNFVVFLGEDIKDIKVWSHATFDFPIVQEYLLKTTTLYMPYKGARDIRTLVDLSGIGLNTYDWSNKTHNALDDCKFQIKYCVDAMRKIKDHK